MAKSGYAGKILILDMTNLTSKTIDTEKYYDFVGGHALATALFWDYCEDKTVDPRDPGNVLVFASTPFAGTIVPSASSRLSIAAVSPFSYPKHWFHHSSMGGRVSAEIKRAGYDAVVILGAAKGHTWVNVVNDQVTFNNADGLWGKDCHETQQMIWEMARGTKIDGEWMSWTSARDSGNTTQNPSVMCIGPIGETMGALATIAQDTAHMAGQGGMGAVMGSKNLKAISFVGTGVINVADPAELVRLRKETQEKFGYNVDNPAVETPAPGAPMYNYMLHTPGSFGILWNANDMLARPEGCYGCFRNCRNITSTKLGNEDICNNANRPIGSELHDTLRAGRARRSSMSTATKAGACARRRWTRRPTRGARRSS